jgi:hypothetical protein
MNRRSHPAPSDQFNKTERAHVVAFCGPHDLNERLVEGASPQCERHTSNCQKFIERPLVVGVAAVCGRDDAPLRGDQQVGG